MFLEAFMFKSSKTQNSDEQMRAYLSTLKVFYYISANLVTLKTILASPLDSRCTPHRGLTFFLFFN